jgi:diguanylate cyclase (GGDEF)-like protein
MYFLGRFSIRAKLSLVFGALGGLAIAIGLLGILQLRFVNEVAIDMRDGWLPRLEMLGEVKRAVNQHRLLAARQLQTTNFRYLLDIANSTKETVAEVDTALADYGNAARLPREAELLTQLAALWWQYREIHREVLANLETGEVGKAVNGYKTRSRAAFEAVTAKLDELVAFSNDSSSGAAAEAARAYRRAMQVSLLAMGLASVLALGGIVWSRREISAPLRDITAAMRRLVAGDSSVAIPESARVDEIGTLLTAAAHYRANLLCTKALAEAAELERARLQAAVGNMPMGLCMFDREHRLIICNERYAQMYGLSPELTQPGTPLRHILEGGAAASVYQSEAAMTYMEQLEAAVIRGKSWPHVASLADGRIINLQHQPLAEGGWVATHEDVTERHRAESRIRHMARHDTLTDLANRTAFRERLAEALSAAATGKTEAAVLCLDLDRFKPVNDTLGHPVGDALLQAVAERLRGCIRDGDLAARLGGDEFAIVQIGQDCAAASAALGQRLTDALSEPFSINGHRIVIGASVGVALAPRHGTDPDQLLVYADTALYDAKARGRGGWRLYDPGRTRPAKRPSHEPRPRAGEPPLAA